MYGGFGYAELRGGGADGRPVFDDVYGQVAGPFFNICIQIHHSPFSRFNVYEWEAGDMFRPGGAGKDEANMNSVIFIFNFFLRICL